MNWKQLFFPQTVHSIFKHARRFKVAFMKPWLTLLLQLGWPRPVARYLGSARFRCKVVRSKHGVLRVEAGDRFLRFAEGAGAIKKLELEYSMWQALGERDLSGVLPRSMAIHEGEGVRVLETDLLLPIQKEDHVSVVLPIVRTFVAAAQPLVHGKLPATVEAGLQLARVVCDGKLPEAFAPEDEIRHSLADPLATGIFHQDLHYRNVMQDADGRSVLIDLKSCAHDRIVAIDLLVIACKYLQAKGRQTMLDAAYSGQRQGWSMPELEPILALVDLPRHLWGQILILHFIGLHALKRGPQDIHPLFRKLLRRILERDWTCGSAQT
jgi:hypothetical protein